MYAIRSYYVVRSPHILEGDARPLAHELPGRCGLDRLERGQKIFRGDLDQRILWQAGLCIV